MNSTIATVRRRFQFARPDGESRRAETLGSVAGYLCSEGEQKVVGLEVNANHIRSARAPPPYGLYYRGG
jgi:hypothetical protein